MSVVSEETTDHGHVADLLGIPTWYREIYPAGDHDGFYHKMGDHAVRFCVHSHALLNGPLFLESRNL